MSPAKVSIELDGCESFLGIIVPDLQLETDDFYLSASDLDTNRTGANCGP